MIGLCLLFAAILFLIKTDCFHQNAILYFIIIHGIKQQITALAMYRQYVPVQISRSDDNSSSVAYDKCAVIYTVTHE